MTTLPRLRSFLTLQAHPGLSGSRSPSSAPTIAAELQQLTLQQQLATAANHYPTNICHHPVQDWVAYIQHDGVSNQPIYLTVSNVLTGQVLHQVSLGQTAWTLFPVNNSKTVSQKLGTILSLAFYDTAVLHWSGMTVAPTEKNNSAGVAVNRPVVVLQTSDRLLFFSLSQGKTADQQASQGLVAHLSEKGLGSAVPSSNVLPLTSSTVLLGCADGSLKCYDWKTNQVLKSIKGLGKGDWIVQLLAANKYESLSSSESSHERRILTVTKKGAAYWIDLELSAVGQPFRLDIKPPLCRFVVGDAAMAHTTILQYDATRDWLLWSCPAGTLAPNSKGSSSNASTSSKTPVLYGWNLKMLKTELAKANTSNTLAKPDPNMIVHIPATAELIASMVPVLHSAFSEDTLVLAVGTTAGELHWMAACVSVIGKQQVQTTAATAISVPLISLLQSTVQDTDDWPEHTSLMMVRCQGLVSRALGHGRNVVVSTNVGILVAEWPITLQYSRALAGARHVHFGAGLGSYGKRYELPITRFDGTRLHAPTCILPTHFITFLQHSVLSIQEGVVLYSSLDVLTGNPVGYMDAKNPSTVYETPPALHLPIELQKRPFRIAPTFLPSPSGAYVCLFRPAEYRYEILHIPSLLARVGQRGGGGATRNPNVASGTDALGFAWLGDEDVFAVLHDTPDWSTVVASTQGSVLAQQQAAAGKEGEGQFSANLLTSNLLDVRAQAKNMAAGVKNAANLAKTAGQSATKAASSATKVGLSATKAATNLTTSATKGLRSSVKTGVKKASFGLFGKKKKGTDDSIMTVGEDVSETMTTISTTLSMPMAPGVMPDSMRPLDSETKRAHVELRTLAAIEAQAAEISGSVPAATASTLGELSLRGGNRNPPMCVWGGPVLCVASRSEDGGEGQAHFYTRKEGETNDRASVYVSSGPTLPFPDLVVWDDDGSLCAVVVGNRVAIYLSNVPEFVMLGTVRIGPAFDSEAGIVSAKFVHGVLYCCTSNSVHSIFLGDQESGICRLDTYMLASSDVSATPGRSTNSVYTSLTPSSIPLPLIQPVVLGYQSGSLLVSTVRGVHAIPLSHPLLRIGTLLAAGQIPGATKWFDAVPESDHEALAAFLERRGHPELAVDLPGISLETMIDTSMRHGFIGRLEEVVEAFGVKGLRAIDMGRGVSTSIFGPEPNGNSVVVCVGAYLLAHGNVELARRLATECLRSGEDGRKDAFVLATLLISVDEVDASRLITRAVEDDSSPNEWIVGSFVRKHVLSDRT